MKAQRLFIGLTIVNLALLVFLLAQIHRTHATEVAPLLRARALQIVDEQDRIRAEILVHGPETVNGKTYPEAVLFRMATAQRAPLVKLTASEEGAALGLSDDSASGGVQLYAHRSKGDFVRVINRDGREQTLKP